MGFLKKNEGLDLFHQPWLACREYPNFRKPNEVFSAVKKWTGFENRNVGRILLLCLAVALKGARVSTSTRWALGTSGGRSGRTRC